MANGGIIENFSMIEREKKISALSNMQRSESIDTRFGLTEVNAVQIVMPIRLFQGKAEGGDDWYRCYPDPIW